MFPHHPGRLLGIVILEGQYNPLMRVLKPLAVGFIQHSPLPDVTDKALNGVAHSTEDHHNKLIACRLCNDKVKALVIESIKNENK